MSMFPIATTGVLSGSTTGANFSNIPQTFTHLQFRCFWRGTNVSVADGFIVRFNNDSLNHAYHYLQGDGSSATSSGSTATNAFRFTQAPGSSATSGVFGCAIIDILDYTNTNKYKTMRALAGFDNNGSGQVALDSGVYIANTNAITQIDLYPNLSNNFAQYSRIDLYGIQTSNATGA